MDTPELMTVQEVADTLRVTAKTVRRMAESGDLPFTRIGRSIRFLREDVNHKIYEQYRKV